MLLIPMALLALGLGGHVGISVPAISSISPSRRLPSSLSASLPYSSDRLECALYPVLPLYTVDL